MAYLARTYKTAGDKKLAATYIAAAPTGTPGAPNPPSGFTVSYVAGTVETDRTSIWYNAVGTPDSNHRVAYQPETDAGGTVFLYENGQYEITGGDALHEFQVASWDGVAADYSTPATFTIMESEPVPPPSGVVTITTVDALIDAATVYYSYSAADVASYQYALDGDTDTPIAATSPLNLTGLDASTEYSVQVRAVNESGYSEWSASYTFTTKALGTKTGGIIGSSIQGKSKSKSSSIMKKWLR